MNTAECLDCGASFTPKPEEPDFCWRCAGAHPPLSGDRDWRTRSEAQQRRDWTFETTKKEAA